MKLDLTYDGKPYVFETDQMTLAEAFTVKAICGLSASAFTNAMFDMDPDAVLAMFVLALRRAGQPVMAKDIDQEQVDVAALAGGLTKNVNEARLALARQQSVQDE